jgi:deoxyinosine 3'endonuclease (endonuclease V)
MMEWRRREATLSAKFIAVDDDDFTVSKIRHVAGVDVSFDVYDPTRAVGTIVVLAFPSMAVMYECTQGFTVVEPYVPGQLAARELEPMLQLYARLRGDPLAPVPDVVLVDGNGVFHPRRCGSATCFGVAADTPAIGVAKKVFEIEGVTQEAVRDAVKTDVHRVGVTIVSALRDDVLGLALCAGKGTTNPVFVSQGHRISLESAVEIVKTCCLHRIPEPIRQADLRSRAKLAQKTK